MNAMKIPILLVRQILKDTLLWCLAAASIGISVVVLFLDQSGMQMCQTANRLVRRYGQQITEENLSEISSDLDAILEKANLSFQQRYGTTTSDLLKLYYSGGFETEEDYREALLMEQMHSCASTDQPGFFSVSSLSGTRNLLYNKLLPGMTLELVIIGIYVMLKILEAGSVANTAVLEYSSRQGKRTDARKIEAAFLAVSLLWLLITGSVLTIFLLLYPGSVSPAVPVTGSVFPDAVPAVAVSELGYLALWLVTGYLTVCFFLFLAGAIGLAVRNSLVGVLILAAICGGMVWALKIPQWEATARWSPMGLFLVFKDGAFSLRTEQWFLDSPLRGKELGAAGAWLIFSLTLLGLSWLRFIRKELKL